MATANDIIKEAKKWVGTKESPANSNNVIFNTEYYGKKVSGSAYPWCAAFVWTIFKYAGASKLFLNGGKSASCTYIMNWYKQRNKWVSNTSKGQAGDLVIFKWNTSSPQHIGIVIKNLGGGTYQTIEGNTGIGNNSNGGEVMVRTRYASQILGFCNIDYDKEKATVPTPTVTKYSYEDFVKEIQQILGITATGKVDGALLDKTVTISKSKNNKHKLVLPVQKYLNSLGYNCGTADGVAGSLFEKAVIAYQKANKLTSDGEITAKQGTWKTLLKISTSTVKPIGYKVKVDVANLRVRSGAGMTYKQVSLVHSGETYTVTEEKNGWGKINSGWICLDYVKKI